MPGRVSRSVICTALAGSLGAAAADQIPIKIGMTAPTVGAETLDGNRIEFVPNTKSFVLYIVTPGCGWCARNLPNMERLWRERRNDFEFIGLSLERPRLKEFLQANPHPFPIYVASKETIHAYGLGTMPSTIVIEKGLVTRKWNGAFRNSLPAVEEYFKVKLLGISSGKGVGRFLARRTPP